MKRKTTIKKPSFIHSLLSCAVKTIAATIVVVLIVGFFVNFYYSQVIMNSAKDAEEKFNGTLIESISLNWDNHSLPQDKLFLLKEQVLLLSDNYDLRICVRVDGKKILDDERSAIIYRTINGQRVPFFLHEESSFYNSSDFITVSNSENELEGCEIFVEDGYAYSDQTFEPLSFDMFNDRDSFNYSYEPAVNWEYQTSGSDNRITKRRIGNRAALQVDRTIYMVFMGTNSTDAFVESNISEFQIMTTRGQYVQIKVTEDYSALESKIHTETISTMKKVSLFAIAFIICASLLSAFVVYTKEKNVYETFEYRRKTTDAMAHDLKTPLAIASGYVENLKENINNDKKEHYLEEISQSIQYMNSLINDILEFSNSQYYKKDDGKETFDVRAEIESMISFLEPVYNARKLEFKINGNNEISTNRKIFNQALMNIISNCVKYANEGSLIEINISSQIVISNDIEEDIENANILKEPFVKRNSERGENGGSGLGLAVADSNLQKLGFRLILESKDKKFIVRVK